MRRMQIGTSHWIFRSVPLMVGKVKDTHTEEELMKACKLVDHAESGFGGAAESRRRTTNVSEK